MSLIFVKDLFKDGSNRFGVIANDDNWYGLNLFLMDDGGIGVHHLLEMSKKLRANILEKQSSGETVEQYREYFGVIFDKNHIQIVSLLTDEILSTMPTTVFLEKLEECIEFIELNYKNQ